VTIPSILGGVPVVRVAANIFNPWIEFDGYYGPNTSVTSITISSGVTYIDPYAFSQCERLISVKIPSSVTTIGYYAFVSSYRLVRVEFEGNAPNSMGSEVFRETDATIYISEGTTGWSNPFAGRPTNQIWEYSVINGEATINRYLGAGGDVSVPAILTGYPVTSIVGQAFSNRTDISAITIPNSVKSIGRDAFFNCTGITSVTMPSRFIAQAAQVGFTGQVATDYIINALANNDAFVTAVANKIKGTGGNYGIATQSGLSSAITTAVEPLATKSELTSALTESRTAGVNSVLSNPNLWTLYTTSQIQNMAVGDLVLTRQVSGGFVLNYDIEQSTDLQTWTPYQALSLPLTGLPTDKAFVRIKAKQEGVSSSSSSQATPTTDLSNPISGGGNGSSSGQQGPGGVFDPNL
jgi:hypothetical protein